MVWFLALCPDDAKQDPVVYGAEFGVVFLAEGPRTASIQEGLDCLGHYEQVGGELSSTICQAYCNRESSSNRTGPRNT